MPISLGRSRKRLTRTVWIAALLVSLLSAVAALTWLVEPSGGAAQAAPPPDLAALEAVQSGFTWIAENVKPAVVFIEVERKVSPQEPEEGLREPFILPPDSWWREFFGPESPIPRMPRRPRQGPRPPAIGQGSGVVIDPSGYIVTNNHVVGEAVKVRVHFPNGETYSAAVEGTDKISDIAVIKIKPDHPLVAAKLGDAEKAKPGSWALAIGYPFGARGYSPYGGGSGRFDEPLRYEPTVTVGVISATNRQLESNIPGRPFRDLIQTDAPINPGSSGGPLLNIHAEVIGINQAIFTSGPWGGNIGVGFAIPINSRNHEIIQALKGGEPVVRGQLGVLIAPLTSSLKQVYGADHGVFVEDVLPDTPASRGGIEPEDIITQYDGKKVTSQDQFVSWVMRTTPGRTVEIEALRDEQPVSLHVTIEALSLDVAAQRPARVQKDKLGLTVEALPEDSAQEMGLSGGVRVRSANPGGDGARAGLEQGDVVVKINREPVTDVESYRRIVGRLQPGDPVVIRVRRNDRVHTAQIERLSE